MTKKKPATYVFIDAANVFYTSKTLKYKIDFERFYLYLTTNFNIQKIIYYTGYDPNNKKQLKFLKKLEEIGFLVRRKPIKIINARHKRLNKANVDVELAIDALVNQNNFNLMILVSGDSDFAYLIQKIKEADKKVWVISARGHIAKELIKVSDKYLPLEKLKREVERK